MIIEQWTQCLQHTLYFLKTKLRFWRQNSNHLGERKNSFGDNFSRNFPALGFLFCRRVFWWQYLGDKMNFPALEKLRRKSPRVSLPGWRIPLSSTPNTIIIVIIAITIHTIIVIPLSSAWWLWSQGRLESGSHLIWKSIAMGWEINKMGNLTIVHLVRFPGIVKKCRIRKQT